MSESKDESQNQVYELGFHIIPTVPENSLGEQYSTIKTIIEKQGGAFVAEQAPERMQLSYTMIQKKETGHLRFDSSYFGWIKFEVAPEVAQAIEAEVLALGAVLRAILVKTVRENTVLGDSLLKKEEKRAAIEEAGEVSEEELEKSIESLVGAADDAPKDSKVETPESVEEKVTEEEAVADAEADEVEKEA